MECDVRSSECLQPKNPKMNNRRGSNISIASNYQYAQRALAIPRYFLSKRSRGEQEENLYSGLTISQSNNITPYLH